MTTAESLLPLIYKKRSGEALSNKDIESFVASLTAKKTPPDYQVASLLAFIYSKGFLPEETAALTQAMRMSGEQFSYKKFPKGSFFADKHSTGGVGDKITLPLVPLVIAASDHIYIPTITGRSLGHTGGTVDKLESIPGCRLNLAMPKFYSLLKKNRACFLMQTPSIAPADGRLYALRDVTGTVESIPLITASILSKKLSESLDFLLLDVKTGNGAFLQDWNQSEALAQSLLNVCEASGVKAQVALTRMDTPLGFYSGNRLEIFETLQILQGGGPATSTALTFDFAIKILEASGMSLADALRKTKDALESGRALKVFETMISSQGGSLRALEKAISAKALAGSQGSLKMKSIKAERMGTLEFHTRALGLGLVELGGGRKTKADKIDPDVGFYHALESGDRVEKGQEVLRIYYRDSSRLQACQALFKAAGAIRIRDEYVQKAPLIRKVLANRV